MEELKAYNVILKVNYLPSWQVFPPASTDSLQTLGEGRDKQSASDKQITWKKEILSDVLDQKRQIDFTSGRTSIPKGTIIISNTV